MTEGDLMTVNKLIPDKTHPNNVQTPGTWHWVLVPAISFGSTLIGGMLTFLIVGTAGSIIASILLAYLAYLKPRKDIVSLLTPLYAVLIFLNDSFDPALLLPIQILYAASLTILVIRLNARFSQKDTVQRQHPEMEPEDGSDEPVSD